jgi:hypothetical protein
MDLKICKICNVEKSLEAFCKNRSRRDGLHYNCKECDSAKSRLWQKQNPEKTKKKATLYRERNRDRVLEADRLRYYTDKEKTLSQRKNYYAENKETVVNRVTKWRSSNKDKARLYLRTHYTKNKPEYMARSAKRRAAKLNATPSWLTPIQQAQIQEMYDIALACMVQTGIQHHVDHIHPLQGDGFVGLHVPWNLQVIPSTENLSKGCRLPPEDAHLGWGSI